VTRSISDFTACSCSSALRASLSERAGVPGAAVIGAGSHTARASVTQIAGAPQRRQTPEGSDGVPQGTGTL
jgi:hypothetical protein